MFTARKLITGFLLLVISYQLLATSTFAQQPNNCSGAGRFNRYYPDSKYVTAPSLENDGNIVAEEVNSTLPHSLGEQILDKSSLVSETRIDIRQRFIYGFIDLLRLGICSLSLGSISNSDFCQPHLSLGIKETEDPSGDAPGINTQLLTYQSQALAQANRPGSLDPLPEEKDCNIETVTVTGNEKINQVSQSLGTQVGYYSLGLPTFKDFDEKVEKRRTKDNLEIKQKIFADDKRVPDIDISCKTFNKAYYPAGAGPCQ